MYCHCQNDLWGVEFSRIPLSRCPKDTRRHVALPRSLVSEIHGMHSRVWMLRNSPCLALLLHLFLNTLLLLEVQAWPLRSAVRAGNCLPHTRGHIWHMLVDPSWQWLQRLVSKLAPSAQKLDVLPIRPRTTQWHKQAGKWLDTNVDGWINRRTERDRQMPGKLMESPMNVFDADLGN